MGEPGLTLVQLTAAASPVPAQMWHWGEPSPRADVAGVSPVPVQLWQGCAQSRRGCGRGEPGLPLVQLTAAAAAQNPDSLGPLAEVEQCPTVPADLLLLRCSTQHTTRNTQHAACNTRHATRSTRHATRNTRHATRNTQHATRNTQHAARSTQHDCNVIVNMRHATCTAAACIAHYRPCNVQHTACNAQHRQAGLCLLPLQSRRDSSLDAACCSHK